MGLKMDSQDTTWHRKLTLRTGSGGGGWDDDDYLDLRIRKPSNGPFYWDAAMYFLTPSGLHVQMQVCKGEVDTMENAERLVRGSTVDACRTIARLMLHAVEVLEDAAERE